MHIDIITLFPSMFTEIFSQSILKRARDKDSKSPEIAEHFSAINLLESEGKILK